MCLCREEGGGAAVERTASLLRQVEAQKTRSLRSGWLMNNVDNCVERNEGTPSSGEFLLLIYSSIKMIIHFSGTLMKSWYMLVWQSMCLKNAEPFFPLWPLFNTQQHFWDLVCCIICSCIEHNFGSCCLLFESISICSWCHVHARS